jgi:hypothetical protein
MLDLRFSFCRYALLTPRALTAAVPLPADEDGGTVELPPQHMDLRLLAKLREETDEQPTFVRYFQQGAISEDFAIMEQAEPTNETVWLDHVNAVLSSADASSSQEDRLTLALTIMSRALEFNQHAPALW